MKIIFLASLILCAFAYDRNGAVNYAYKYVSSPNHSCGNYIKCTPCSYWGSEACGYGSNGGDCANFVSQCLVKGGGHAKLNSGDPCRGYPCGFEEIGAKNLGRCLQRKGWTSTCGYHKAPPSNIQKGDVLIYHTGSCGIILAHAVLVTVGGSNPKITCHSSNQKDVSYTYMSKQTLLSMASQELKKKIL